MRSFVLFIARHILVLFLVFLAFFLYLASAITNTGWFLLITSFIFGFLFVCFILSYLNTAGLQLSRSFKVICSRGDKLKIKAEIKNDFFLPSFLILVKDPIKSLSLNNETLGGMTDFIGGYSDKTIDYEFSVDLRGSHDVSNTALLSPFPFGLFFREKKLVSTSNLLVIPKIPHIKNIPIFYEQLSGIHQGNKDKKNNVGGTDFYGMRDYNSSDGMRSISWAKSAQKGKLIVKDFSSKKSGDIVVCIDEGQYCETGSIYENPFEYMVSLAGGISDFAGKNSLNFSFLQDGKPVAYRHMDFLNMLALKKNNKTAQMTDFVDLQLNGAYLFFLSCDPLNVKKIFDLIRTPFTVVFFDALSFGKLKNKDYKTQVDSLSGLPVFFYSEGEDLSFLFERKGQA